MRPLLVFLLIISIGVLLELAVFSLLEFFIGKPFRTNHKYSLEKNASLISIPIWGLIALIVLGNYNYAGLFLVGAIVGTSLEYIFGKLFNHIEGHRIWMYRYMSIGRAGYTSYLSIPYWGGATLLFVLLAKFVGV